ncbi:MAG: V-type ATPase subunit [Nanoarchaeota archaeon]|nr:V-type ATPase subunit [Nanoarchaeota archaeon]
MRLRFNPYTYVRVGVMRTLLLKEEEYGRLLKMSFSEIAEELRKTNYKQEIEERGMKYSGTELIEHALNANHKKSYEKLLRIADEALSRIIKAYLFRNDIWNIKTILRSKMTRIEDVREIFLPGTLTNLDQLLAKESLADVIKASGLFDPGFIKGLDQDDLMKVENDLDRYCFKALYDVGHSLPEGRVFRQFIENIVDVNNVTTIFKLLYHKVPQDRIMEFMIDCSIQKRLLQKLASSKDVEELIDRLKDTPFKGVISKDDDLLLVEAKLQRHLLKRAITLLHKNLLSVDIILAYMLSKEIEIINLKRLVKGKQLGVPNEMIEKVLVV